MAVSAPFVMSDRALITPLTIKLGVLGLDSKLVESPTRSKLRQSDVSSTSSVLVPADVFMNIPPHGCTSHLAVGKHDHSTFVFSSAFVPCEQTLKMPPGERAAQQHQGLTETFPNSGPA